MDNSPIREAKRQWLNTVVKDLGVSQREVADRLELPYANFNAMLNGHRAVSDDTVDLVHQRLGVALPLSGYSLSGQRSLTMPIAVTVDQHGEENIVCVDVKARAGYIEGLGDPVYLSKLPSYRLPYLGQGTFRDFTIQGFSMYNPDTGQIRDKSHVIARWITAEEIRSSRVHVVVTESDVLIKRVYPEDGTLRLRSDNPDRMSYPDIVVELNEVREVWYVEQFLSANIPPRSTHDEMEEMRTELDQLRRSLHNLEGKIS